MFNGQAHPQTVVAGRVNERPMRRAFTEQEDQIILECAEGQGKPVAHVCYVEAPGDEATNRSANLDEREFRKLGGGCSPVIEVSFETESLGTAGTSERRTVSTTFKLQKCTIKEFDWSRVRALIHARVDQINSTIPEQTYQHIPKRNTKSYHERYWCIDPEVTRAPLAPQDRALLLALVNNHGRRWSFIANLMHPRRTPNAVKNFYYRRGDAPTRAKRKSMTHDAADAGYSKRRELQESTWSTHDHHPSTVEGRPTAPAIASRRPSMLSSCMLAAEQGHIEAPLSTPARFISGSSQEAVYHDGWAGGHGSAESGPTHDAPSAWPTVESQHINASASYPTFHPVSHANQRDMQHVIHSNHAGLPQSGYPQALLAHGAPYSIPIQSSSDSSLSRQGASPRFALHGVAMSPHGSTGSMPQYTLPPARSPSDPRYTRYAAAAPDWPQSVVYSIPGRPHREAQTTLTTQSWQGTPPPGPITHAGMPPPGWQGIQSYDTSLPRGSYAIGFAAAPARSMSSAAYTSDGYHIRARTGRTALPSAAAAGYAQEQAVHPPVGPPLGFPTRAFGRHVDTPEASAGHARHGEQQPYSLLSSSVNAFDHTYGKPREGTSGAMQDQLHGDPSTTAPYMPLTHTQASHEGQALTGDTLQYRPQWPRHSALAVPVSEAVWPPPQPGQYPSTISDRPLQSGGRADRGHRPESEFGGSFAPKHGETRLDDGSLGLTPPRKPSDRVGTEAPVGMPGGFDAGEFGVGTLAEASNDSGPLEPHW